MTTLLIDGDIVAFQAAAATEHPVKWDEDMWTLHAYESEGQELIMKKIDKAMENTGADDYRIYLTGKENFRKEFLPSYKENRKDVRKPLTLVPLKEWLIAEHGAILREPFEADDMLGIRATRDSSAIIMSEDKDLKTIPALYYNPAHSDEGVYRVKQKDADLWFMTQVLTGDTVDNYKGCPGIGPVKAQQIIQRASLQSKDHGLRMGYIWQAIVAAYEKAGLTEEDAIVQARCARILRDEDITSKGKIIPWQPPEMPLS